MKVVALAGSLRRESLNKQLLKAVIELAPKELEIRELIIDDIPLYNGDLEAEGTPGAVVNFKQAVAKADGVLIFTPEYSHTIPGVLKNTLDWASREKTGRVFDKKPVAIGGASDGSWGTTRSQLNIRLTLGAMGAYVMPLPHLYVPKAQDKFTRGKLIDEATKKTIQKWLAGTYEFFQVFKR